MLREAPLVYELPSPQRPDLDAILRDSTPQALADSTRRFRDTTANATWLGDRDRKVVVGVLDDFASALEGMNNPAERIAAKAKVMTGLKAALRATAFASFEQHLFSWATTEAMTAIR